jgi:hypothetical protein
MAESGGFVSTGAVVLTLERASEWPLLDRSAVPVECLAANAKWNWEAGRDVEAEPLAEALTGALGDRLAPYRTWLLIASAGSFETGSRISMYWHRKRRLFDQFEGLGAVAERGPDFEFDIPEDGRGRVRHAAGVEIGAGEWGSALRVMFHAPAVGVSFKGWVPPEEWLAGLAARVLSGEGGDGGGAMPVASRRAHLRRLFLEEPDFDGNVLTIAGEFDDYWTSAEYFHALRPGEPSLFEGLPGVADGPVDPPPQGYPQGRWSAGGLEMLTPR